MSFIIRFFLHLHTKIRLNRTISTIKASNMKKITLLLLFVMAYSGYAQVGINTTKPTTTLDVNGTMRLRGVKSSSYADDVEAVRVVGIDADGNLVEVEIDENLILENNRIRAIDSKVRMGSTSVINIGTVNNLGLIILPGEPNDDKRLIRILSSVGNVDVTGIVAGEDGQTIWVMAYDGTVRLRGSNAGSDPENRFAHTGNVTLQQYEMVQLLYDATLQKWLVMGY